MALAHRMGMVPPKGESNMYGSWKMSRDLYSSWVFSEAGRQNIEARVNAEKELEA